MFLGFLFLVWMLSFFIARGRGTLTSIKLRTINIAFYLGRNHKFAAFLFTYCSVCDALTGLVLQYVLFFFAIGLGWKMYKAEQLRVSHNFFPP